MRNIFLFFAMIATGPSIFGAVIFAIDAGLLESVTFDEEVHIVITSDITYDISGLLFVFEDVYTENTFLLGGEAFAFIPSPDLTKPRATINDGLSSVTSNPSLFSGDPGPEMYDIFSPRDLILNYYFDSELFISDGDIVTIEAGTILTPSEFTITAPNNLSNAVIGHLIPMDYNERISGAVEISIIPEHSSSLLIGAIILGAAILTRRKRNIEQATGGDRPR